MTALKTKWLTLLFADDKKLLIKCHDRVTAVESADCNQCRREKTLHFAEMSKSAK